MAASQWPWCRQICALRPRHRTFRRRRSQARHLPQQASSTKVRRWPRRHPRPARLPNTTTVTIIDGKTGEKQEVVVPAPANGPAPVQAAPVDAKFVEMTPHGAIPKIAADGTRPADAFARPVKPLPGKPDAPRIALIVEGLGVSANATSDAIAKLPSQVTLGLCALWGSGRCLCRPGTRRRSRALAASADGTVRLSGQ